jgi:hypothetical protein
MFKSATKKDENMDLWKVVCNRSTGKVLRGINIEVISSGSEPNSNDILIAVNKKYNLNLNSLSVSIENWSMEKLS